MFDVTASRKDLVRALGRAAVMSDRKSTLPILANVLLTAQHDVLMVEATNLNESVSCSVAAKGAQDGTLAAPGRDLLDRVKLMPEGPVRLQEKRTEGSASAIVISAQGVARRFTVRTHPGADFPPIAAPRPEDPRLVLPSELFAWMCGATFASIGADEARPHLNGGYLEWRSGSVFAASTDGHSLSKASGTLDGSGSGSLLIPKRALAEARKIAEEEGSADTVTIAHSGTRCWFETPDYVLGIKLYDAAAFPSFKHVMPSKRNTATVPRGAFVLALQGAALSTARDFDIVKLELVPGMVRVSGESAENGASVDEVPADFEGKPLAIHCATRLLLDALAAMDPAEDVAFDVGDSTAPISIRPVRELAGRTLGWVVMPMLPGAAR